MQADDETMEVLNRAFYMPNLIGWWDTIWSKYKQFGFTDELSDVDRIEEFDYIAKNLNKYISSHQIRILEGGDLEAIKARIEDLHSKADDGGRERKKLVYAALRDDWLISLLSLVESYMGAKEISDEWI